MLDPNSGGAGKSPLDTTSVWMITGSSERLTLVTSLSQSATLTGEM